MSPAVEENADTLQTIPTGSLVLDWKLGTGGWPRGRIVEIFGPEGGGKTTLLLEAIAQAQQSNGLGAFLDADHATEPRIWERLGVNTQKMLFHRPTCLEEAFEKIEELVRQKKVDVIALDSIAALVPEKANSCAHDVVPSGKNEQHRHHINHCLRALLSPLAQSGTTLLIANQVVEKVGVMFGSPETTPWETMQLRNYASQRVELRRSTSVKTGDEVVGYMAKAKIVKNRLAPPHTVAEIEILFATGISAAPELLELGMESGLLTKRGGQVFDGDTNLGKPAQIPGFFAQNSERAEELRARIVEQLWG